MTCYLQILGVASGFDFLGCHTPNSTGVIYVTILPPDFFFFSQLESKLHLE